MQIAPGIFISGSLHFFWKILADQVLIYETQFSLNTIVDIFQFGSWILESSMIAVSLRRFAMSLSFVMALGISALGISSLVGAEQELPKVKVFILTGQSNMEGKGLASHLDTYKEDPLIRDTYPTLKQNDSWVVRNDVWITYPTKSKGSKSGGLTVGYGTKGVDSIGPEFGFGHTIGEAIDAPVVVIKIAWGGKSLAVDFRPPSAGLPDQPTLDAMLVKMKKKSKNENLTLEDAKAKFGHYYRQLLKETNVALDSLGTTFPELKNRDYEIAGIVWHQGFNDKINKEQKEDKFADYTKWLAMFIKDLRKDLNAENAPFVIGELSTGGIPSRGDFQTAQAAAADLPEFKGNVTFVPTAEFYDTKAHEMFKKQYWKGTEEQKALWKTVGNDRPYHYLGSGKTYYLKGQAFAEAMLQMMAPH